MVLAVIRLFDHRSQGSNPLSIPVGDVNAGKKWQHNTTPQHPKKNVSKTRYFFPLCKKMTSLHLRIVTQGYPWTLFQSELGEGVVDQYGTALWGDLLELLGTERAGEARLAGVGVCAPAGVGTDSAQFDLHLSFTDKSALTETERCLLTTLYEQPPQQLTLLRLTNALQARYGISFGPAILDPPSCLIRSQSDLPSPSPSPILAPPRPEKSDKMVDFKQSETQSLCNALKAQGALLEVQTSGGVVPAVMLLKEKLALERMVEQLRKENLQLHSEKAAAEARCADLQRALREGTTTTATTQPKDQASVVLHPAVPPPRPPSKQPIEPASDDEARKIAELAALRKKRQTQEARAVSAQKAVVRVTAQQKGDAKETPRPAVQRKAEEGRGGGGGGEKVLPLRLSLSTPARSVVSTPRQTPVARGGGGGGGNTVRPHPKIGTPRRATTTSTRLM